MQTRMVDVGGKPHMVREAIAEGRLHLRPDTLHAIRQRTIDKGDVPTVAAVAALQAVKRTADWLPLCHPLPITHARPVFTVQEDHLHLSLTVATTAQTGVEMEALTGVVAGLLCAWDMVKPLEKDEAGQYPETRLEGVRVVKKEKRAAEAT